MREWAIWDPNLRDPECKSGIFQLAVSLAKSLNHVSGSTVSWFSSATALDLAAALNDAKVIISAGAAGATLLAASVWQGHPALQTMIDLNAVPPLGIEGIEATDRKTPRGKILAWGALGVGRTKMKIHKKAIQELFVTNDKILDAERKCSSWAAL